MEVFATDGTREALEADGVVVAPICRPDGRAAARGRPGQDVPPAGLRRASWRAATCPPTWPACSSTASRLIDLVVVNVHAVRAPGRQRPRAASTRPSSMIDVGGTVAPLRGGTQLRGRGGRQRPAPTTRSSCRSCAIRATYRPRRASGWRRAAFAAVAAYDAEVAAYLNHISGDPLPRAADASSCARSATCPTARTRTRWPRSTARRPIGAARSPTPSSSRGRSRPSTTCSTSTPPTGSRATSPHRPAASRSRATRSVWPRQTTSSRRTRARSKATRSAPTARSSASTARSTRRPPRELTLNAYEGGRGAGLQRGRARGARRARATSRSCRCRPRLADGLADYGIADLDFHRIEGGLLVETRDQLEVDHAQLNVVTRRRPTLEELTDLLFAWRAVRHVTSNAVVHRARRDAGRASERARRAG